MSRFAAIDVGTNTVLMAVAEKLADGQLRPFLERAEITRLGEGADRTRRLSREAITRTVEVVARFSLEARRAGAHTLIGVATSAARDAENGHEFVAIASERAGIELKIVSGDDEARLMFRAVQEDFGQHGSNLIAIDIGGGSTELVSGPPRGVPTHHASIDVGSVRLTERFVTAHPIPQRETIALRKAVRESFEDLSPAWPGALAVAVAATATSLADVLAERSPDARAGKILHLGDLEPLAAWLASISLEERRQVKGLDPRRADVICAGAYILIEALRRLELDECRVSDRGVRWGLLLERFGAR